MVCKINVGLIDSEFYDYININIILLKNLFSIKQWIFYFNDNFYHNIETVDIQNNNNNVSINGDEHLNKWKSYKPNSAIEHVSVWWF